MDRVPGRVRGDHSTLFDPLILAVFAIVLRGAGFAFRKTLRQLPLQALTGGIFAFSSLAAPFFMGTAIGAIASGQVPAGGGADRVASWTGGFPLLAGALFAGTCAWLAAAYLTVNARHLQLSAMVNYFSGRARAAGLVTGLFAAATLADLRFAAPREFTRLTTGPGLPFVIVSAVAGTRATATCTGSATTSAPCTRPRERSCCADS